jgi:hypothetical protein
MANPKKDRQVLQISTSHVLSSSGSSSEVRPPRLLASEMQEYHFVVNRHQQHSIGVISKPF